MSELYSVDLGTWEDGITVRFTADGIDHAIKVAHEIGRSQKLDVVQVRVGVNPNPGPIVFDSFNGKLPIDEPNQTVDYVLVPRELLTKYLAMESTDGRIERQQLRAALRDCLKS